MNKELQDKVWNHCLPREFKEEVKKIYNDLLNEHLIPDIEDSVNNQMLILEEIFSYHNLTSDAENPANVTSKPKFKVGDYVTVHFENGKRMVGHINEVLLDGSYDVDLGNGCMMHNVKPERITQYTNEKYKSGDKVKSISDGQTGTVLKIDKNRYPQQYIVVDDNSDGLIAGYFTESDLEPYTEPHNVEDKEVSKPTHSFGMEEEKSEPATSTLPIRLQVATAAMQGLLNATSAERFTLRIKPSAIAKAAVEYADALLAECGYEKKGD